MEKVLDLKMPGVQELGKEELKEVDGGFWKELAGLYLATMGGLYMLGKDIGKTWAEMEKK